MSFTKLRSIPFVSLEFSLPNIYSFFVLLLMQPILIFGFSGSMPIVRISGQELALPPQSSNRTWTSLWLANTFQTLFSSMRFLPTRRNQNIGVVKIRDYGVEVCGGGRRLVEKNQPTCTWDIMEEETPIIILVYDELPKTTFTLVQSQVYAQPTAPLIWNLWGKWEECPDWYGHWVDYFCFVLTSPEYVCQFPKYIFLLGEMGMSLFSL